MTDPALLRSLQAAVDAAPRDLPLRLHLAELLVAGGDADQALVHAVAALQADPSSAPARALMARVLAAQTPATAVDPPAGGARQDPPAGGARQDPPAGGARQDPPAGAGERFDWRRAEEDLGAVVPPVFVESSDDEDDDDADEGEAERPTVTLDDVGGMRHVKERLQLSFLGPMSDPRLRALYGKSLSGGLLLYGPPGCGKTFIARALAGQMGAGFLSVALSDVLDMWLGNSERNLHRVFQQARRKAPCVLFLDEVDAIGMKRSLTRNSGMRTTVQQLLTELDGMGGDNEGVFVLAATNAPWDVDPALRRPGRLGRTVLVLPPDAPAREAILRHHLQGRPVAGVDLAKLVKRTEDFSGADLASVCESAAERALADSMRTGTVRTIGMTDLLAAVAETRPSTAAWLEQARNVALYANESGEYDELRDYLRKRRLL
ncbi:ATPase family protein associated with various cellular activities (AAA) [Kineococcus xinjiangensis]|uniref:ATPase family protein associated with various cellular activities (AAA) n=1 Tax=Kineococcus xinjiangensis TaxID=512762 RepID=A0A2S6ICX6_9ACTN|nr:AAA family ATPase [Kineococcus xinjiangensis]PPK92023.1 ATPase family protein associated with various cellular activities (AAA) [Kineococcus xinjiangensis]